MPQTNPTSMEGRLAIFTEKWIVALVRVHSIRMTDRGVHARIQAIPTQGLYGKNEIEIGCIHEHLQSGKEIWVGRGYCGWRVFFAPALIEEVLAIAASLPKDWVYDPADRDFDGHHAALTKPLWEYEKKEAPNPDLEFLKKIWEHRRRRTSASHSEPLDVRSVPRFGPRQTPRH